MTTWFEDLNLIRFFEFYLALIFLISTSVRIHQYLSVLKIVRAVPGRWPRLFALIKQQRTIFFTWSILTPALLALGLLVIHTVACRLVWPQANLTPARLVELWPAIPFVLLLGAAMVGFDAYGAWNVAEVDRKLLEQYFDQAEYWLKPWTAPAVKLLTFGHVDPRQMVTAEVSRALQQVSELLQTTLWWVARQTALRIAFGLSLWLTYAFGH